MPDAKENKHSVNAQFIQELVFRSADNDEGKYVCLSRMVQS